MGVEDPVELTIEGGTYSASTTLDSSIGSDMSPEIRDLPEPRPLRQVAGFELATILLALGLFIIIRRHR